MAYITNTELLTAVADRVKVTNPDELPAWWASTVVPQAVTAGYQDILGALLNRGFSKAQVDAWDRRVEFNFSQSLYWALVNGGAAADVAQPDALKALDRREELKTVLVFVSGVWVQPPAGNPGLVTTAGPNLSGGVFGWPDPSDGDLGTPTHW
jgi:hypothetical protein